MRPWNTVYPALGRYFNSTTELANAACMSRSKCWQILSGEREFSPQEKRAIAANIIVRMERGELGETEGELLRMYEAYDDFDKVFRIGA